MIESQFNGAVVTATHSLDLEHARAARFQSVAVLDQREGEIDGVPHAFCLHLHPIDGARPPLPFTLRTTATTLVTPAGTL